MQYGRLNYFLHLKSLNLIRGGYLKPILFIFKVAKLVLEEYNNDDVLNHLPPINEFELDVKGFFSNYILIKVFIVFISFDKNENMVSSLVELIEQCSLAVHYLTFTIIALGFIEKYNLDNNKLSNDSKVLFFTIIYKK